MQGEEDSEVCRRLKRWEQRIKQVLHDGREGVLIFIRK